MRDREPAPSPASAEPEGRASAPIAPRTGTATGSGSSSSPVAPSRQGKKAMTGYFSPEMSFAMHMTARKHGMSLQDAMAEAFNDWLRKMGESPVGK
nr:ribbon-helix-helix domain-containing protein [Sphingopyxis sp. DBS4]